MNEAVPTKVVIGCQGGGAHAAFEAGVLTEILNDISEKKRFDLIGISGTSAGALCALMVWYGFAPKCGKSGSAREASERLNSFWDDFAAKTPAELVLNAAAYRTMKAQEAELPVLGINAPVFGLNASGLISKAMTASLPPFGVRKEYYDFDTMIASACPDFDRVDWPEVRTRVLLGASEVVNGIETVFDSDQNTGRSGTPTVEHRWRQRLPLTLSGIAASGSLPTLREAERIGRQYFWDGLYSQNPPIREFVAGTDKKKIPDEVWILRINPQQWPELPVTTADIEDRQNELMGNLSLNKELDFILTVNEWCDKYKDERFGKDHQKIVVRTIKMTKETADKLRFSSKFNRSRDFLEQLRAEGRAVAEEWLSRWHPDPPPKNRYPDDAAY
jgi:NTE family protein